jgi:hypothetical protein
MILGGALKCKGLGVIGVPGLCTFNNKLVLSMVFKLLQYIDLIRATIGYQDHADRCFGVFTHVKWDCYGNFLP